jgi:hypothetical protein
LKGRKSVEESALEKSPPPHSEKLKGYPKGKNPPIPEKQGEDQDEKPILKLQVVEATNKE